MSNDIDIDNDLKSLDMLDHNERCIFSPKWGQGRGMHHAWNTQARDLLCTQDLRKVWMQSNAPYPLQAVLLFSTVDIHVT